MEKSLLLPGTQAFQLLSGKFGPNEVHIHNFTVPTVTKKDNEAVSPGKAGPHIAHN
jgi:hypothetical protein